MRLEAKQNATDDRYINQDFTVYSERSVKDFGNVTFNTEFTDEAASSTLAFIPILDELARRFNIPRIRGFKSVSGNKGANQGDGVMGMNPNTFNYHTSNVKYASLDPEERQARIKLVKDALKEDEAERDANHKELIELYDKYGSENTMIAESGMGAGVHKRYQDLSKRQEVLYNDKQEFLAQLTALELKEDNVSKWQQGEDIKKRPFSAKEYVDSGIDRLHHILLHEFGHHVHQYYGQQAKSTDTFENRAEHRKVASDRPIETWMAKNIGYTTGKGKSKKMVWVNPQTPDLQAAKYGTTNAHEWFAENFALYWLNKRELVDPVFTKLIESMLRGEYQSDQGV